MKLKKLIETTIREYLNEQQILNENILLADKIYFKTGKLSDEDKEIILNITNRDNYTKLIADFYFYFKENSYSTNNIISELKLLYNDVLTYNKNVFPIIGYDVNNPTDIWLIIWGLQKRRKIIENLKKLPSIATRNMKDDIRQERTSKELDEYSNDLEFFISHYNLLANRDEETQIKILRKMFKANTTLEQLMGFVDDKSNFIGGVEFTRDDIKKLSKQEDFEIIYEQGDIMIIRVDSPQGIKAIGCNSLWCFTYGSGFESAYIQWSNYSHNDMVYVLIDFREKSDSSEFMHVLIKPLIDDDGNLIEYDEDYEEEHPIFNMSNENYINPYSILKDLFGKNFKKIINKYLNFEY
jgi:hypothetical protein